MIESILLDLPIPEIFLQQLDTPVGATEFVVVDGQQRIRAILEFIGAEDSPGFELLYLDEGSPYQHKAFADLSDDERVRFFGYQLVVRFLSDATDTDLKNLFLRFNRYLTKLTNQELRNATYSGPFKRLVEELADDTYWSAQQIVGPQSIRRMGDIEFVSDLLFGQIHGPQGGDPGTLDRYWAMYDEYEAEIPEQSAVRRRFNRTRDAVERVVQDLRSTRWHNKSDFYSIFVALAHLLDGRLPTDRESGALRRAIAEFTVAVERRIADREANVSAPVQQYVPAIQRGSTEKSRRVDRHEALLEVLRPAIRPSRRRS
jgi:hypothetical protein